MIKFLYVDGEPSSQSLVRRSIQPSAGLTLLLSDEERLARRRFRHLAALLLGWMLLGAVALVTLLAGKAHGSPLGDCTRGCTSAQDDCYKLATTTAETKLCDKAADCCRLQCEGKPCGRVTSCSGTNVKRSALAGAEGPGCGKPPQPPCQPPAPKPAPPQKQPADRRG